MLCCLGRGKERDGFDERYLSLALRHLVLFAVWIGLSLVAVSWLLPNEALWRVWVLAPVYYAVFFLVSLGGRWQRVLGIYLPVLYMKGLWYLAAVLVWLAALLACLNLADPMDGLTAAEFPFRRPSRGSRAVHSRVLFLGEGRRCGHRFGPLGSGADQNLSLAQELGLHPADRWHRGTRQCGPIRR